MGELLTRFPRCFNGSVRENAARFLEQGRLGRLAFIIGAVEVLEGKPGG